MSHINYYDSAKHIIFCITYLNKQKYLNPNPCCFKCYDLGCKHQDHRVVDAFCNLKCDICKYRRSEDIDLYTPENFDISIHRISLSCETLSYVLQFKYIDQEDIIDFALDYNFSFTGPNIYQLINRWISNYIEDIYEEFMKFNSHSVENTIIHDCLKKSYNNIYNLLQKIPHINDLLNCSMNNCFQYMKCMLSSGKHPNSNIMTTQELHRWIHNEIHKNLFNIYISINVIEYPQLDKFAIIKQISEYCHLARDDVCYILFESTKFMINQICEYFVSRPMSEYESERHLLLKSLI